MSIPTVPDRPPRVVIVGAGFGGLRVARGLRGRPVDVLLLDRRNYHTFVPLLYQVATAGLEPEEIAQPVRSIVRGAPNVRFRMADVRGVDFGRRAVLAGDEEIAYDYLVLAAGSATNYFGQDDIARASLALRDLTDATELRNHVLAQFEHAVLEHDDDRRRAHMAVVVVGGGPTGVELAGALAELKRHVLPHDYPELPFHEARVLLLEATDSLLPTFPRSLRASALRELERLGVEVRLNAAVASADERGVVLRDGQRIDAGTLVWVAGLKGPALVESLGLPAARGGRVPVRETLQLPDRPEVFAIGDMAYLEGPGGAPYPMLAPVAIQQGDLVASNILRLVRGEEPRPFRYKDRGTMVTIGRQAAVAQVYGLRFSGLIAWVLWLTIHLVWLIGFRNRLLVLINWVWNYLFYERGARLITRE